MSSQIERLEESRDNWSESVKHDRRQFLASFSIAAAGLAFTGVGVRAAWSGDVVGGVIEIGVGSAIAFASARLGLGEVQNFADATAQAADKQSQIDKLTES